MSNGNYTWEQVMLGIDVKNEAAAEALEMEDIERKRAKEANAMSGWSLGLSILGAALGLGPFGYFAGKQIGKYGADWGWFGGDYSDWEKMEVSEGKFDKETSRKYNRLLKDAAKDQTLAQAIGTVTDLAAMYVQAGGLTEGALDLTTFGSGGVEGGEWTVWGRGDPTIKEWVTDIPKEGGGTTSGYQDIVNPDYKPGIFEGGGTIGKWYKEITG
ncbi:hypothetical protein CMI37_12785 [Candidatus Pacearchaeota archaeon]|nr:hypothetical protein [Candidatus Pacearchaeota archaeon]